jgi:PAS domain S-box-containing protein
MPVGFAGRTWELQMPVPAEYGLGGVERATWWIVLAAGLALTLFATVSTYSLLKSRQAADTDLRLISSQFRVILDSALEAILLIDAHKRVVWANQAFADAFGYEEPATLVGIDWTDLLSRQSAELEDTDAFVRRMQLICRREEMTVASEDVRIKAPQKRILSMTSAPIIDDESAYLGRLWVYRDVTAEREADRTKTEFVSMVSHELRTPLTSLTGFVELVLDGAGGEIAPEGRRMLNIARANGERLTRLVSDVLDISRLETGRFELSPEFVFLGDLLRELSASMSSEFQKKGISLNIDVEPGLPRIWADRERTAQVLSNLLTNACRYTAEGGSVSVSATHAPAGVVLAVSDTGVGIAREDQGRVFDKFVRLRDKRNSPKGATGLGLAISKSLVELQGGTIRLESEPGKGSSFIVTLPIRPPADRSVAA